MYNFFWNKESGDILVKYIDKFLKFLRTDRNTFFTYILTLFTIYFVVDRIVEILFICFSGIGTNYWGPIKYTLALACPVFAFLFSGSSKFVKSNKTKFSFFYLYCISLYIISLSMFVTWFNELFWLLIMWLPNYTGIVQEFPELIKSAFTALAIYLPIATIPILFKFLYMNVNDSKDLKNSIVDYRGIDLSPTPEGIGQYTCEMPICKDKISGKMVVTPEIKRFEATLVVGTSGSGKTSMIFEPMIAKDLEKKHFFKEISKEMGFTALKTGIATLNCPYDNNYINKNFSLSMLQVNSSKEKLFKAYMNKITYSNIGEYVYKNLGITYIAPDGESAQNMIEVAKNFDIPVNVIDPSSITSIGLNPFVYDDPIKVAIIISSVLKGMASTNNITDSEEIYKENLAFQAVENITILLKEMYPRVKEGILPTLEDVFKFLNDFDLVEVMCEKMKKIPELDEKYIMQLSYFKKNFYRNSPGRNDTEKYVSTVVNQLDTLLRYPGVKNILCNRTNNINFDNALKNGEVTIICTRRGDLGATAHKAFGMFSILLMQHSVLSRPGTEKTRIPHFLYIDEFPLYISKPTEPLFTLYRKYRVGTIVSAQNLSQLDGGDTKSNFRSTILSNCSTKIFFGNNTPEDNEWWAKDLGKKREWQGGRNYDTAKGQYEDKISGIKYGWVDVLSIGKIQKLPFKNCGYKTKNIRGRFVSGQGLVDFLPSKYKEIQETKSYNFAKFTPGMYSKDKRRHNKFDYKSIDFDIGEDNVDPIRSDESNSKYLTDNEDSISFDLSGNSNTEN